MSSAFANIWTSLEGEVVDGKYHLSRLINAGGFGGVFEADEVIADHFIRRVAIKLISVDDADASNQIRELTLAAALDHPRLLRSFSPGEATVGKVRIFYSVMELASRSLGERMLDGKVDESLGLDVVEAVLGALEYLAALKEPLVHRDIKPDNILLVGQVWKLADFGLLKPLGQNRCARTSSLLGTAEYAPPEAFEGVITPAWDMWSLGVTIVEMMTGSMPFSGATPQQLQASILAGRPEFIERAPEPLRSVAAACLKLDRDRRPAPAQARELLQPRAGAIASVAVEKEASRRRAKFPFQFRFGSAETLAELIDLAQEYPHEAQDYLFSNYFSKWLNDGLHLPFLAQEARRLVFSSTSEPYNALELLLREMRLSEGRPVLPVVTFPSPRLDFGLVSTGEIVHRSIRYECGGRGHIWGKAMVEGNVPGLSCGERFTADGAPISVTLDALNAPPGIYRGRIVICPVGYTEPLAIPVSYSVAKSKATVEPKVLTLGDIEFGETLQVGIAVRVANGRGRVAGTARVIPPTPGIAVQESFKGDVVSVPLRIDTRALQGNREYVRRVRLATTGGTFEIPLRFRVTAGREKGQLPLRVVLGAVIGAAAFGLVRVGIGSLLGNTHIWVLTLSVADSSEQSCRMVGTPIVALISGYLFRRICRWRWPLLFEAATARTHRDTAEPARPTDDDERRIELRNI